MCLMVKLDESHSLLLLYTEEHKSTYPQHFQIWTIRPRQSFAEQLSLSYPTVFSLADCDSPSLV